MYDVMRTCYFHQLAIFIALSQDDGLGLLNKDLPDDIRVSLGNDLLEKSLINKIFRCPFHYKHTSTIIIKINTKTIGWNNLSITSICGSM